MSVPPFPQSAQQMVQDAWTKIQLNIVQMCSVSQDIEHYVKEMNLFDDELKMIGSHQLFVYRDMIMNRTTPGIDTTTRMKSLSLSLPFYSKIMILYSHNHSEYERLLNTMVQLVNDSNRLLKENFGQAIFYLIKKQHGNYLIPNVLYREKKEKTFVPSFKPPTFPSKNTPVNSPPKNLPTEEHPDEEECPPMRTPREEESFEFLCERLLKEDLKNECY